MCSLFHCSYIYSYCFSDLRESWKFYGSRYYKFVPSCQTWDDAVKLCELENAALVNIDNPEENEFVRSLAATTFWIGLHDKLEEDHFVWVSGSNSSYRHWIEGQPNNLGEEDCAQMISTSTFWNDNRCEYRYSYICEKGEHALTVQFTCISDCSP